MPIVVVAAVAVFVYTRFSFRLRLTRDEAIYAYSSIRLEHGTAPYESIWDPKTPGTSLLGALAIALGHLVGLHALTAIRLVFFLTAVLTAVAVYLLGRVLWHSVLAAGVGVGVFLCFQSWAFEAPTGPDAKMPGIFLAVLAMALAVRSRWFAAAFAAGLAFLFWQPLLVFVAVVFVAAVLVPGRARWRALAFGFVGAAIPIGATVIYFAAVGALRIFLDAAFVQPATGAQPYDGFSDSTHRIQSIISSYEHFNMWTFWIGIGGVVVVVAARIVRGRSAWLEAVRDPLVCVVGLSLLAVLAFSVRDFQNYPDLDPLLPYPALGFGGIVVLLRGASERVSRASVARLAVPGICVVAVLALLITSIADFQDQIPGAYDPLGLQRAQACALSEVAGPGTLYSLGDTIDLGLTHRVNPDNYIYFGGGVLQWKLAHLPGGVQAWERQILATHPRWCP